MRETHRLGDPAGVGDILPDVLVKGEDWAHYVSGRDWVEAFNARSFAADPHLVDLPNYPETVRFRF